MSCLVNSALFLSLITYNVLQCAWVVVDFAIFVDDDCKRAFGPRVFLWSGISKCRTSHSSCQLTLACLSKTATEHHLWRTDTSIKLKANYFYRLWIIFEYLRTAENFFLTKQKAFFTWVTILKKKSWSLVRYSQTDKCSNVVRTVNMSSHLMWEQYYIQLIQWLRRILRIFNFYFLQTRVWNGYKQCTAILPVL